MNEKEINELVEKEFPLSNARPEVMQKIKIDNVEISIFDLMRTSYKKGLEKNFAEEIKSQFSFSENPKFETNGLFANYYVVAHLYSQHPELCIYDGNCLRTIEDGILIKDTEVVGAVKVDIPYSIIEKIKEWRDINHTKVTLNDIANHIVFHEYDKEDEEWDTYIRLKRKYEGDDAI